MKVLIINGVNLNLLGSREQAIYGTTSFEGYLEQLKGEFSELVIDFQQSNIEGELVNFLHAADKQFDAVVLNAGAYTHTSIALADAVAAISTPVVEVHISNIFKREDFRHVSYLGANCVGSVSGFGIESYALALIWVTRNCKSG